MVYPSIEKKISSLLELSKSGIVTLVLISVLGGYLIGQPPDIPLNWKHLVHTLLGVLFLSAGSSGLNQYQDREMDSVMTRTRGRPLPSGRLNGHEVVTFVLLSLVAGVILLSQVRKEVVALGLLALVTYNGFYTLWWKRNWAYAAVPGAIPGALPVLIGHTASSGQLNHPSGIYLFSLLFFWQMPHFWVLALKYRSDYEKGGVPTLPVIWGRSVTVFQIILWCLGYFGLVLVAPLFLKLGFIYWILVIPTFMKVLWELKLFTQESVHQRWLSFFLWVNFSLVLLLFAIVVDLWSVHLLTPLIIR